MGLSAAVPGAGQFYNGDYWKIPVIIGIGANWAHEWNTLNNDYRYFRDKYESSLPYGNSTYKSNREFYRDERDRFAWYIGALYFINILDAYVGAHLYDFDVGPSLSLRGRNGAGISASVKIRL